MATNKYPRGSEWRKWDLHLHTPGTAKNDLYGRSDAAWEQFISRLESNTEIAVLGITDYFSIDNYLFLKKQQEEGRLNNKTLIPNVELRILPVTQRDTPINIHVLFDPKLSDDVIEREFFRCLKFSYQGNEYSCLERDLVALGRAYRGDHGLDDNTAKLEGIAQFNVAYDVLRNIVNKECLCNNVVLAISNSNRDGNSGIQHSSLAATRQEIYRMSDIIFSANNNDVKYFLGEGVDNKEEIVRKYGGLKPCVIGSDAHSLETVNVFPNNKCTWIKADPTFEGLKQILYEPESRVRIQEMNPDSKADYQVMDTVTLDEPNFWKGEICLNPYLNTVIGGRSTGKSTLLQCIAKKLGQPLNNDDSNKSKFISDHYDSISIRWKDGDINTQREIMFFPQNHMIDLATDQHELNKLLEKIVKEKDERQLLDEYNKFLAQNRITISNQVNQLFLEQAKIDSQIALKKQKGDEKGIEAEISKIQEKIENIKSDSYISEDEIKRYNELATSIAQKQGEIKTIENDVRILGGIIPENLFNIYYENELGSLSEEERTILSTKLEEIKRDALERWKAELSHAKTSLLNAKQQLNQEIEIIQAEEDYKKGYEYFQKNKEYKELQEQLKNEVEKLSSIKEIDRIILQLQNNRDNLKHSILDRHYEYRSKLNDLMRDLSFEFSNVSISLKISLKEEQLKTFLQERHNLRGFDRQGYIDSFVNDYKNGCVKDATQKYLDYALLNELDYKGGYVTSNVTSELLFTNWYDITFHLEYDNDSFDNMSQGKKSFVILKLLLDFSDKKCPILLDQPEDSLDNRAIYNELVEYLRKKKLDRQLIIVTHNSNVVVSADSENVIVANQNGIKNKNQDGYKFQYISGALEYTKPKNEEEPFVLESQGIREHVCEILEGGVEAFKKREQKYGI